MHDAKHESNGAPFGATQTTAAPAPGGLRSTIPSRPAPTEAPPQAFGLEAQAPAAHAGAPAYGQPQAYEHAGSGGWGQPQHGERRVVEPADTGKRAQGVKNILGGAALIGIGFLFGGSVFLGNPGVLDWVFDGLGTFWVCKGIHEVSTG